MITFPEGFVWGAATASYQIEGGARAGGRGPSIWDTFSRTPAKVFAGHTGDVACDHYHQYAADVALMSDLGLGAYRFSVAWPRIRPDGTGPVNPQGLDFYDRLVDELRRHGIAPVLTLYHWDLPQPLEDRGGWTSRDTAEHFAAYAAAVYARLGDRVDIWTTLNEPWCSAFLGYGNGVHAPGRRDPAAAFAAAHHLLLGHGLATQALRAAGARTISLTLNPDPVFPADPDSAADIAAVHVVDGLKNRIFFDPVLRGKYPPDVLANISRFAGTALVADGDERVIGEPIDVLGVNYYSSKYVRAQADAKPSPAYPGAEGIRFLPPTPPVTDMGWRIEPSALVVLLDRISNDYPGVPLLITENGAAYADVPSPADPDRVADPDRISYLDGHLRAAHEAIAKGVDLRGYFVWSLMDNFEWAEGYRKRFGLIHVDYDSQRRTIKDSGHWYREVIRRNGLT